MTQKSLKSHIVKYGAVSLAATGVFIFCAYLLNRYLTVRQAANFEGNKLVASAHKQAEQILPGLLLPEEYGSIDLQLKKIRETEDLLSATYSKVSDDSLSALLKCPKTSESTHVCASYLKNQIVTATEVGLPGNVMGYLIKHKRLTSLRQDNIMLLSLATLFCSIALVFLGLIASILIFIERHLRKPLLNLSQNLSPILDGENGAKLERFDVAELQSVATQVEQLVRKYEEKKATAATGELAAQVAHDIRSPLAALDSATSRIAQLPEDQRLIIRSAVSRIRDIANSLLDRHRQTSLDRWDTASGVPVPQTEERSFCLLSSLIEPLITEKRLQYRSRMGVEIDSRMDESSYGLFAKVQPVEFKRVLSNLINNAVEAINGAKGGLVVVMIAAKGDRIVVEVKDNGKGIPAELVTNLGVSGETYGKPQGCGLGLHHAKTYVESWGGDIEISSEIGKGTTVAMILPQASAPDWFLSELRLSSAETVVILDDDTSIHQVWRGRLDALRREGNAIETVHFSTPNEIRKWVRDIPEHARDAVYLLDYELLGFTETGLSLAKELGIGERTILVTSRYEEPAILEECRRLKARMIPKGLAGLVPICINQLTIQRWDAVLIDDDPLVRMTWSIMAAKAGKKLRVFSAEDEFFREACRIDRQTIMYVDQELGNGVKGDEVSLRMYELGFREIYLATGHEYASHFTANHLKGVTGKEPPWTQETLVAQTDASIR